ncbi:peptidoglycan D,D-transpeptidase FtsI family protein [Demequina mangrovi]|uniref:Cell elongation-specific peptidoglycan D,D-transpeptidase n=1 Tax=Demequina mangrovi TaxID=1043493 RepID=A0A1H6ZVL8_9MICO|nr:penicillin-binding protein 2 [Demequina mangrovi]SEJ56696.1 cell elongation-specific peptidoglycan D,D-transpeptidase [Demequina mangrovi]
MNEPVRRLSVVVLAMFLTLMVAASYIQVIAAGDLNADARNVRTLYREYGTFRGPIVVDGESVVWSSPVDDPYNYQRTYSDGPLYAAATGYYSTVFGRTGIEQTENDLLSGTADSLFWTRLSDLVSGETQRGASVELTLDAEVQQAAASALGDDAGAVVALDPRTGEVLAMVTSPTYDPAVLANHSSSEVNAAYQELLAQEDGPLVNRAIAGDLYPPGSTFKLIVAAAALEAGYDADSELYAPDELDLPSTSNTISNYGGKSCAANERQTLAESLEISCNTSFANLGMQLGWSLVESKAAEFGWGEQLSIPLAVTPSVLPDDPDGAQTAMASLGQFDDRATPLQMAMVAAGIANDGVLMRPYLVDSVRDANLRLVEDFEPEQLSEPMTRADANELTDMMVTVVESGTGTAARISGVEVAGKTGTAETGTDARPHAWFVGFAPADDPVVAVAVLVENGGTTDGEVTGGRVAAPIAKAVMEAAIAAGGDS